MIAALKSAGFAVFFFLLLTILAGLVVAHLSRGGAWP
jgi:hypothetical protein